MPFIYGMNIIDIILLIFIFALAVYGFLKGFVSFLTKVLAIVGTAVLGVMFGEPLANIFRQELNFSLFVGKLLAYVLIFLAVVVLLKIFSVYLHKGLAFLDMGIYDRFLGVVFIEVLFLGFLVLLGIGFNLFFNYNIMQNPNIATSRILSVLFGFAHNFYPGVI